MHCDIVCMIESWLDRTKLIKFKAQELDLCAALAFRILDGTSLAEICIVGANPASAAMMEPRKSRLRRKEVAVAEETMARVVRTGGSLQFTRQGQGPRQVRGRANEASETSRMLEVAPALQHVRSR